MLTLLAEQPECLWDDALPIDVKELPEDLAALDVLLSDPGLLWPLVERWRQEFRETGRLVLTEGRPTIALEMYVRLMVLKQRYGWGYRTLVAEVSDSIHLRRFCRISLSDAGRIDGPQAHAADRPGDGVSAHARADREGDAGEAVSAAGGEGRLDGDRGGCEVPDRCGAGIGRGARAGQGGPQAGDVNPGEEGAGAGSLAGDGSQAQNDHPHDPSSLRRSQAGSTEADWRDGEVAGALDPRDTPARCDRQAQGARARCPREAEGGRRVGGDGGSLREGRSADQAARRGRADQEPDRVAVRSRRPADPQGQAAQAQRIRVRQPFRGGDREHQAWGPRADPAGLDGAGQPGRGHAAAGHGRRAHTARDQRAGGRARRWVQRRADDRRARGPSAQERVHRCPPGTGLRSEEHTSE